jgi:SAM-dependent methyltransferase
MVHPRVIRDLCRFPMWIIENIEVIGNRSIAIIGWALTNDGDLMSGAIAMNGKLPDEFTRTQNPEFSRIFRWHDNADWAPYRAVYHGIEIATADVLRFSYVGQWTRAPFNRWQDIWVPLRALLEKTVILPDGPRMRRTQGNAEAFWYATYGVTSAQMLNEVTETYFGKQLSAYQEICDWGAGCGRVVQAVHRIAPRSNITGIDIDRDNMEWCERSIPFATFAPISLFPPTPFSDASFDLLYGISVFTHLAKDAFEAWRDEIYRIIKPGGVVLVTIHGSASTVSVADEELILRTLANGFDDSRIDPSLGDNIDDQSYYRGTFISAEQTMKIFGLRFRVRDILPQAGGSGQDLVVCERV